MGDIEAIFFDIGNTLRLRVKDEEAQREAMSEMATLLGTADPPEVLFSRLAERYQSYRRFAQSTLIEATEQELWTRWMLPDSPVNRIAPMAKQLTLLWREHLGHRILRPGAQRVVEELSRRGYSLGVVSNTISAYDVPHALEDHGLARYFSTVTLSCTFGRRKPDPAIFLAATNEAGVDPGQSAYVGDKPEYDVVGARQAGFAMTVIVERPGVPLEGQADPLLKPDVAIHDLSGLLDIFLPRRVSNQQGVSELCPI